MPDDPASIAQSVFSLPAGVRLCPCPCLPPCVAWRRTVYKEYGKNFQLIAQRIGSKTLAEVIEWYYQDFKDEPE